MATNLRLTTVEDRHLTRLARTLGTDKHAAVAAAIDLATPRPDHTEFVRASTVRLLDRYADLLGRLAAA